MAPTELREKAARCRRLASVITDLRVEVMLQRMAEECDLEARNIEAAGKHSQPAQPNSRIG